MLVEVGLLGAAEVRMGCYETLWKHWCRRKWAQTTSLMGGPASKLQQMPKDNTLSPPVKTESRENAPQ